MCFASWEEFREEFVVVFCPENEATTVKIALFHRKYPGTVRHINATIFDSIPFTRVDLATSWWS
jgi:hypothetical protein